MRPLTELEARTLRPVGEPGEFAPGPVFVSLIERGLARWGPPPDHFFEPTELGLLALRVYDAARSRL